jgi:hypothetical protein
MIPSGCNILRVCPIYGPDMISSWMKKIVTWTFSQIEYDRRKGIGLLEFALYTMARGQGEWYG